MRLLRTPAFYWGAAAGIIVYAWVWPMVRGALYRPSGS